MPNHKPLPTPVGWFGGKSRLAKALNEIVEYVPHRKYVEPFAGGASLYFYKKPSDLEVINDINKNLVKFYKELKEGLDLSSCDAYPDKERWLKLKKRYDNGATFYFY